MPRPVCIDCRTQMKAIAFQGVVFVEGWREGVVNNPIKPQDFKPRRLWKADAFECETCKHSIVVNFGRPHMEVGRQGKTAQDLSNEAERLSAQGFEVIFEFLL